MTSVEVSEEIVSATCHDIQEWVAAGRGLPSFLLRHPRRVAAMFRAVGRLPRLDGVFSRDVEGRALQDAVRDGRLPLGPLTHKSVLVVPDQPGRYALGPRKRTLRRKVRKAAKLGVRWTLVEDAEERRELLTLATRWERTQPDDRYRNEDADNDDLLDFGLWLAAYREPGEYLLLCVVPVDGEWANLRHYRTIGRGEAQSEARYLLMDALVEELVRRGVRYLLDGRAPAGLPNGLRHFQRIVGFRIHRVRSRLVRRPAHARVTRAARALVAAAVADHPCVAWVTPRVARGRRTCAGSIPGRRVDPARHPRIVKLGDASPFVSANSDAK